MANTLTAKKAGTSGKTLIKRLTPLAGILAFLVVWEVAVIVFKVRPYLLPAPTVILQAFIANLSKLMTHGWVTTYEMMLGYILAVVDRRAAGDCHHVVPHALTNSSRRPCSFSRWCPRSPLRPCSSCGSASA